MIGEGVDVLLVEGEGINLLLALVEYSDVLLVVGECRDTLFDLGEDCDVMEEACDVFSSFPHILSLLSGLEFSVVFIIGL
jgi:hypothetical protein